MLDRARATSLALLGATAAVGLAIVALALNQGWPLLEGSAIPAAPRQDVGRARVVPRPARAAPTRAASGHGKIGGHRRPGGRDAPARTRADAVAPSGGEEATALVVSEQAPARAPGGAAPKAPPAHGKSPASPSPPASQPAAAPTSSPPPQAPIATPAPAPAPTEPAAVASEAPPEESGVPAWSHGNGHAYGRDESGYEDGYGGDGHDWGHGGEPHGHNYGD